MRPLFGFVEDYSNTLQLFRKDGNHALFRSAATAAICYHCNLTNMQFLLNYAIYPSVDMDTDVAKGQRAIC